MASSSPWHHLYNTKAWHRLRWHQLQAEPLCKLCHALGRITAASVVDHRKPHKGDESLFFDATNLDSLCKPCHDRTKQQFERTGVLPGCDASGVPLDPGSHWHR
ncbi:HNH endonuclease [Stutzerimonas nitrititolerans]|uniref:HNH endonuclease n=1 Tax=Stutzerimonas nitrititolerans TaxID=2482751 RepID=UPI0028AF9C88|nr:HNH endonuclease [Stutzerimonas nitrititolerans]